MEKYALNFLTHAYWQGQNEQPIVEKKQILLHNEVISK